MKNVVVIPAIQNKSQDKFNKWSWMDCSIKAWQYWCDANNCELVIYDSLKESDLITYRDTWQRWFDVFDLLEERQIQYDKVLMVDASTMPKWDCPNFFDLVGDNIAAVHEMDNLKWIYESVEGYKEFFNNFDFSISKYVNAGFIIFNKSHKELFEKFKELFYNNQESLIKLQTISPRRGTDQTAFNYFLQINNITVDMLPIQFRVSHLARKDLLSYNWQLNEDKTPFFVKYASIWMYSGFDKTKRSELMEQTWDIVKNYYDDNFVLNIVNHKHIDKDTTSRKFKEDIYKMFSNPKYKDMTILDMGCNTGNTTRIYSECFKKVIAVDYDINCLNKAKDLCKDVDNVEFIHADVYDQSFTLPNADVVHVDAGHQYDEVCYDIDRCITQMDPIIIMDDYGHKGQTVRNAIIDKISEGKLQVHQYIGEGKGYIASNNKVFIGNEGVICNVK